MYLFAPFSKGQCLLLSMHCHFDFRAIEHRVREVVSYPDPDSHSCGWITSRSGDAVGIRVWVRDYTRGLIFKKVKLNVRRPRFGEGGGGGGGSFEPIDPPAYAHVL